MISGATTRMTLTGRAGGGKVGRRGGGDLGEQKKSRKRKEASRFDENSKKKNL